MIKGQRAGEGAIAIDVEQGKSYYWCLSLIHISEPTRLRRISYAVFCLKKKKKNKEKKKKQKQITNKEK